MAETLTYPEGYDPENPYCSGCQEEGNAPGSYRGCYGGWGDDECPNALDQAVSYREIRGLE